MNPLYISAYTVNFDDYSTLGRWIAASEGKGVGVELATAWKTPDFYEKLEENAFRFSGVPVTLHAPFVEICTDPGSREEAEMQALFDRAFALYRRFSARSMVMHTHEGTIVPERRQWAQERSFQVLQRMARRAAEEGAALTVENVGYPAKGNQLFDLPQFIELIEALPREPGCLIDVGHALLNGWEIPQVIRRLGTRICGYHLHTNDGQRDRHWPLFVPESVLSAAQTEEILNTIAQVTPKAHVILEYSPKCGVTEDVIHHDLQALRQYI